MMEVLILVMTKMAPIFLHHLSQGSSFFLPCALSPSSDGCIDTHWVKTAICHIATKDIGMLAKYRIAQYLIATSSPARQATGRMGSCEESINHAKKRGGGPEDVEVTALES